jgi:glycosyltransferase involved in cell wall biosynthesis
VKQPGLSVVVPVYDSQASLVELVERLRNTLCALTPHFEIILVNDGSRDQSWNVITDLETLYAWVIGINLMRNYGQHNALLAGIRQARYEIVVTLDDDLQNPPEEIPKLLDKLREGYDVVYGRPDRGQHGLWRNLASRMTKLALQKSMGVEVARNVSAYRVFRTSLREVFSNYHSPFVSIDVLLTWATTRFAAVNVHHDPRMLGQSNYNVRKLLTHALNMMTGFSTWPLQVASLLGFASTVFGIIILAYVLGRYLVHGSSVAGFPFLASIISIFAGAQLFALGVIGEYLARMHFRSMERPTYAIRVRETVFTSEVTDRSTS